MEAGGSQRVRVLSQSPGPWKDLDWTSNEWQAVRGFEHKREALLYIFVRSPWLLGEQRAGAGREQGGFRDHCGNPDWGLGAGRRVSGWIWTQGCPDLRHWAGGRK